MLGHLDEKIKTFLSASFVQKGDVVNTLVVTHCVKSVQIWSFSGPYLGTFHAVIVIAKAHFEKSDYEHLIEIDRCFWKQSLFVVCVSQKEMQLSSGQRYLMWSR